MRNNGNLLLLSTGVGNNFFGNSALPSLQRVGVFTHYSQRFPNIPETNVIMREKSQGQIESAIQSILLSQYTNQTEIELPVFQQSENMLYEVKKKGKGLPNQEIKIRSKIIIVAIKENETSEQRMIKGCTSYFKINCKLKFSPMHIDIDAFKGEFIAYVSIKSQFPSAKNNEASFRSRMFQFHATGKKFIDNTIYLSITAKSDLGCNITFRFSTIMDFTQNGVVNFSPSKINTNKYLETTIKNIKSNKKILLEYEEQAQKIKQKRAQKLMLKCDFINENKNNVDVYKIKRNLLASKSYTSDFDKRESIIIKKKEHDHDIIAKTLINIDKYVIKKETVCY